MAQRRRRAASTLRTNAHKWLFTNFDCDLFWVADRQALISALSILPEYLRNAASESGAVIDYRDWHVPLGRRFRALKLWFVLRHYGAEGLRAALREDVALAQELAGRSSPHPRLELAAPAPLSLVCLRHRDGDEATKALLEAVNADGGVYLTHTVLAGRYTIRVSIGTLATERRHVDRLWALIDARRRVAWAAGARSSVDRASGFYPQGRGFESSRARHVPDPRVRCADGARPRDRDRARSASG